MVASKRAVSGNDVPLGAGLEQANGEDHRIEHVELPGDHGLQGGDHFS